MSNEFKTQVKANHYNGEYDSLDRFISYYYQIDLARGLKPKNVLEIGIGNKTVANYLNQNGTKTTTCDFDAELNPDYVADVRKLPFEKGSFDLILACEILEHIPWGDIDETLRTLCKITNKNVVISVPYSSVSFELVVKVPFSRKIFGRQMIDLCVRVPQFFREIKFNGEHYWEIGRKGYSLNKVRGSLKKYFDIKREIRPILNPNHYYFVLEKK